MKAQRHYRLPTGYELTNELTKRVKPFGWKHPKHKSPERPQFGPRKSKTPVTLSKP